MKHRDEIIRELESHILARFGETKILQSEIDALEKSVSLLKGCEATAVVKDGGAEKPVINNVNYPNYPMLGSLLDKYRYLEDFSLKVWLKKEMDNTIWEIEGTKRATKTFKSDWFKIQKFVSEKKMIRIKYGEGRKYTFYTTRQEWIERLNDSEQTVIRIYPEHQPDAQLLDGLSEDEKNPNNISWEGIN